MQETKPPIDNSYLDIISWLRMKAMDGYNAIREEPVWNEISRNMDYVEGRQDISRKEGRSTLVDNRTRRALFTTVSNLTDVRPVWDYNTNNSAFKPQAEILNKLALAWWKDTFADKALQNALKFSGVGGTGYIYVSYNTEAPDGGNIQLDALDPRDVIPIGYPTYGTSIQDWKGVLIRQRKSLSWLKEKYPHKASQIHQSSGWFMDDIQRRRPMQQKNYASVWQVLKSGMTSSTAVTDGTTDFMRIFIKDSSIHRGDAPLHMGRGNWAYTVYPVGSTHPVTGKEVSESEARIYPGGRLIICTPTTILDDCPNPYWHGMFPVVKVSLEPVPWSLLGISIVSELKGLQDDLNTSLRGLSDNIKQHIKRAIIADKMAIPKDMLEMMDTSDPGWRVRLNPSMGEGFKVVDPPQLPSYYMDYIAFLKGEIDDAAGIKDLEQLAALKQMPSPDTVQQFMEAMTPLLKLRAREMEQSLGEIAQLVKVNFFQFYDLPRRIRLLGQEGVTRDDVLDFDPNSMVPSLGEGEPGYRPELDKGLDRIERAREHHKNFTFHVTPNTFLNITNMQRKMLGLQLYRMGALDIWSLWNLHDIPGVGPEPARTIPERLKAQMEMGLGMPPEMMAQMGVQAAMQAAGGGAPPGEGGGPPPGGGTGKPPGRPPTGAEPPKLETRMGPDGPRQLVSESG